METINHIQQTEKVVDRPFLMLTHLSQLLTFVTAVGGIVVPLVLWLVKKDEIQDMDEHGKAIINFQLSLIILGLISIPCILLFGLGILMLIAVGIASFVMPIVNAIRANNGERPSYFMTFRFLK
jgi:uncharacterized Tic20 family protein